MKISEEMLNRLKNNSNEDWKELLDVIRPSIQRSIVKYSSYEIIKDFIDEIDYYIFEYIQNYYKKDHHVEAGILFWMRQKIIDECRRRNKLTYDKGANSRYSDCQNTNGCVASIEIIEDKGSFFPFTLNDSINIFEKIWSGIDSKVKDQIYLRHGIHLELSYLKQVFMMRFRDGIEAKEISKRFNRNHCSVRKELAEMKAIAKKEIKGQMFF